MSDLSEFDREKKKDVALERDSEDGASTAEEVFAFDDSRKMGVLSASMLILNKMIGTGSKFFLPGIVLVGDHAHHGRHLCFFLCVLGEFAFC